MTFTPLEIHAEPTGQADRINAMFDRWTKSFNLIGFKLGEKPLGFRAQIQFRHRREGLTFPTELRYDTFRAVTGNQTTPVKASTRTYDDYRITKVTTEQELGGTNGN